MTKRWDVHRQKIFYRFFWVLKSIAAITPGIQPQQVRMNTSRKDPHPLSMTASGGKIMQRIARKRPIGFVIYFVD
jgi:hypothetical protein